MRSRKTKRAPLPPTSTPCSQRSPANIDVSPVIKRPEIVDWEDQKQAKDEENRSRRTISGEASYCSLGIPNKSTYGIWKRKKGPAPSRPIPQKRTIKSLPISEIKRELEVIEIQQQGLEKQGVKLEQIIREKTEAATGDLGNDSSWLPSVWLIAIFIYFAFRSVHKC